LYNAFILGFSLASDYGGGWHAQNGMEMDDLCFFSIRFGAFQMDMLVRLAFLVLRNTKRYLGDACMKQEWAGKLYIWDC